MGAYTYKYVRDQLPPHLTYENPNGYDGAADYDGDQWAAASDYIDELEAELAKQFAATGAMQDTRLLAWLRTRPKTNYCTGPVIPTTPTPEEAGR